MERTGPFAGIKVEKPAEIIDAHVMLVLDRGGVGGSEPGGPKGRKWVGMGKLWKEREGFGGSGWKGNARVTN